jgi:hypothetical protein
MPVAERRQETESRIAGPFYQRVSDNWPDTGPVPGCDKQADAGQVSP